MTRELDGEMSGRPQYPGPLVALADDDEPTREATTMPDAQLEALAPEDVTLVADKSSSSIDVRALRRPLPPPTTPPPRELPRPSSPPRRAGFAGPAPSSRPSFLSPLRVVAPPASSARWTVPDPPQSPAMPPVQARRRTSEPAPPSSSRGFYEPEVPPPRPSALPRVLLGAFPPSPSPSPAFASPRLDLGEATDLLPGAAPPGSFAPASSPPSAIPPSYPQPQPAPVSQPIASQPMGAPPVAPASTMVQGPMPAAFAPIPQPPASFPRPAELVHHAPVAFPPDAAGVGPLASPRMGPSRAAKLGAICGAASLVLSLGIGVLSMTPRRGALRVELESTHRIAAEKAEVFVDGDKVCDVAPCVANDLTPGLKTIRVIGPGIAGGSAVVTATVEAGRERLAMVPVGGDPPASPAGAGEIHVASSQAGVRALVDGVDHGMLPLDLKDVPAGVHRLRFEGGDQLEPLERQVEVGPGRAVDLGSVRLKLAKGRITVDDAPSGARVLLVRNTPPTSERVLPGPWPTTFEVDAVHWQIVASKKGQGEVTEEIAFDDGQADKHVRLQLRGEPAGVASTAAAPAVVAAREPAPAPAPARAAAREPPAQAPARAPEAEPRERPAAQASSGTGTLSMNSLPLSKVLVDGRPLGSTPKVDVPVPAGTHTVTFVHPDLGKKSVTVTVRAGESASASVRFRRD